MKKTALILLCSIFLVMCTTKKTVTATTASGKAKVVKTDDFKGATEADTTAELRQLKATEAGYSVMILAKNFKGENIVVSSGAKQFYKGYPISNLGKGLAEKFRVENSADITVYDTHTKKEAVLKASDIKKHKFVYISKNPAAKNPFVIIYSNKLKDYK
jgi:hypothetical protein